MTSRSRVQAHELDQTNAPATLSELCEKAAIAIKKWKDPRSSIAIVDGDFDHHPYVQGQVDLIFAIQKQAWHTWDDDVAKDWIRFEIKERVFGG